MFKEHNVSSTLTAGDESVGSSGANFLAFKVPGRGPAANTIDQILSDASSVILLELFILVATKV